MVISDLEKFTIRPLLRRKDHPRRRRPRTTEAEVNAARDLILQNASHYIAQPQDCDAVTVSL